MASVAPAQSSTYYDFRNAIAENRLRGLWRMMTGFHWPYVGAVAALAISALAKTATFLLLRYFADLVTGAAKPIGATLSQTFLLIALGFIGCAAFEGGFAFLSGRLAAYTAENITRRLRNFLFDHKIGRAHV